MNDSTQFEAPVIEKRKWPYPLIWIVPILTAAGAGLYLRDYLANRGPEIEIEYSDASGLKAGETRVLHRGAEIGKVTSITLAEDHKHALVHVLLQKQEDDFATEGAQFWVVKPEISQSGLSGLGTLFSGPYINALPGKGDEIKDSFKGLARTPRPYEAGLRFVLTTGKLDHVQDGSAVYYKGIPVGTVEDIKLSNEADHLDVHVVVWTRYEKLVRENSVFWVVSGFEFKGGIFSGVELNLDSMQALMSGGVAFGTQVKGMQGPAKAGTHYALLDSPPKDWQTWSPKISISPKNSDSEKKTTELPVRKPEKD